MRIAVVPNYANLFMDRFETKALEGWPLKPIIWLRFIDDIFMIWPNGKKELDNFIKYLNGIHEKIKFTSEVSSSSINFLDTTVKVDTDKNLYTTLDEKPKDTCIYTMTRPIMAHATPKAHMDNFLDSLEYILEMKISLKMVLTC